ncbi:MAG: sodium:solute symporter family protein [Salinigranum sp.]
MAFDPVLSSGIILAYLVVTLGIGIAGWRISPSKNMEDYLLADRAVHWFVGFFSTIASQFSALTLMGFVAFYFKFGISTFIAITGAYILFTSGTYYFIGPKVWKIGRKFGHITPSDTVREYYDSPLFGYIVAVGMILALIAYLEVQLMGVGILLKLGSGGVIPVTAGAAAITVVIAIYTWLGGMKSVAWVDTVQGVMLLGGAVIGGFVLLFTIGGGFGPAFSQIASQKPALLQVPGPAGVWNWVFIATFAIPVFLGWVYHPHMWMRLHYFKSGRAVENLPWVSGGIFWLTQIGGLAVVLTGALIIPDAPPDQFILLMFRNYFPTVAFALVASAALAAIMSSASSQCHGIGAVAARDVTEQIWPEWEESKHLMVARVTMLIGLLGAFFLSTLGIPFLVTSGAAAAAISTALIFPQVIAAVYGWEWPTREGAVAAGALGLITSLVFLLGWVSSPFGVWPGFWGLVVNVVAFVVVSSVTNSHPEKSTINEWQEAMQDSTVALDREHRENVVVSSDD